MALKDELEAYALDLLDDAEHLVDKDEAAEAHKKLIQVADKVIELDKNEKSHETDMEKLQQSYEIEQKKLEQSYELETERLKNNYTIDREKLEQTKVTKKDKILDIVKAVAIPTVTAIVGGIVATIGNNITVDHLAKTENDTILTGKRSGVISSFWKK